MPNDIEKTSNKHKALSKIKSKYNEGYDFNKDLNSLTITDEEISLTEFAEKEKESNKEKQNEGVIDKEVSFASNTNFELEDIKLNLTKSFNLDEIDSEKFQIIRPAEITDPNLSEALRKQGFDIKNCLIIKNSTSFLKHLKAINSNLSKFLSEYFFANTLKELTQ